MSREKNPQPNADRHSGANEINDVNVSILYYIQLAPLKYFSTILIRNGRRLRWFNMFKKSWRFHSTYKPQYLITSLQRLPSSVSMVSDKFVLCYAQTGRNKKFSFDYVRRIAANSFLTAAMQPTINPTTT